MYRKPTLIALGLAALLPLTLAATPASAATTAATATHTTGQHRTGDVVLSLPKTGTKTFLKASASAATLPASVDLTKYAMPAQNQADVGSCVAFAVGYTLEGWWANKEGLTVNKGTTRAGLSLYNAFSPMFIYTQLNGGSQTAGINPRDAYKIASTQGVAPISTYSSSNSAYYDFLTKPTAAQTAAAAAYKLAPATTLYLGNGGAGTALETSIKQTLAAGQPVTITLPTDTAFQNLTATNSVLTEKTNSVSLTNNLHEVVILGYSDAGVVIENSWGSWGNNGFATINWDYINNDVLEADTTTGFATATPTPAFTAPPSLKTVKTASNGRKVSWTAPTSTGGKTLTYYLVSLQRTTASGASIGSATKWTLGSGTFSLSVGGLKSGYYYKISVAGKTSAATGKAATVSFRQ